MRARAEMRSRWRAWASLATLTGIVAGCSIAAAAGARRTDSAYPRFLRAQDAYHAITAGGAGETFEENFAAIKQLPAVADWREIVTVGSEVTIPARRGRGERVLAFPDAFVTAEATGTDLYETNRAKVIDGRLANQATLDEVMVPWSLAERHDIRVGDQVVAGIGFSMDSPEPIAEVPLTVVGIIAAPGEFDAVGQVSFRAFHVTPALLQKYREHLPPDLPDIWSLAVHLRAGASAAYAFKQEVEDKLDIDVPFIEPTVRSGVEKTMGLYAAALWLVAAFVAIAGLAVIGQTLARQISLDAAEFPTLRAVGMTRRDLFVLGFGRAGVLGLIAAPLAIAVAFALSPFAPIGAARIAEPDPGFAFDGIAMGLGVVALILALFMLAAWPAIRSARLAGHADQETSSERSLRMVAALTRSSSPAIAAGFRMALERGRGRTAVPVRSTIMSVAIGVAAVTATLGIGASLLNLIDTPELAGLTYDAIVPHESEDLTDAEMATKLEAFPFVEATTEGTGLNITIGGIDSFLVAFRFGDPIGFATIDGRAPTSAMSDGLPEVALGPATMRRLGLRVGGEVSFVYATQSAQEEVRRTQRARIVGVAAVPPVPWAAIEPGEGAVMPVEAVRSFSDEEGGCCFVRFVDGTDLARARTDLSAAGYETFLRPTRADLLTLERVTSLPIALIAIFGSMAVAALAHVLVTGIRRRRRDLAVLKTIGFINRQVRGAIAWQSSALVALCTIVGVPAGFVIGRWAWAAIADRFGVVAVSVAPVTFLVVVLPVALIVANVIAILPGRAAARTQPAVVLRSE